MNGPWDVVVIGTGIGGGTIGRRLAERGLSVLFVEKGNAGHRLEETPITGDVWQAHARSLRGLSPNAAKAKIDGRDSTLFAPIGSGVGGSSVFYAATLEQPERHDLDDSKNHPHPTGGWPVKFDEFAPYFDQTRKMYQIHGTENPLGEPNANLSQPQQLAAIDASLFQSLSAQGLQPYHAHTAIARLPECLNCVGHKCPKACKMDGRSAGVEPALLTGHATLWTNATVTRFLTKKDQITGIEILRNGEKTVITANQYVLAAGAFASPNILLASNNSDWPKGVANSSGLVGRNLMFHLNEMFALWPKDKFSSQENSKTIASRDIYYQNKTRFGMVQSMGISARYGEILHYLNRMYDGSRLAKFSFLQPILRLPAMLAEKLLGGAQIFVGILEDLPYAHNRVIATDDPDDIAFEYQLPSELHTRRRQFRRAIRRAFRGHRKLFLHQQAELNFGHPCGTMCFGDDPKTSVLNMNCRAHDIENLYVVDSSFFPTSMGVNPSLMIAANALRVGDHIAKEFKDKS